MVGAPQHGDQQRPVAASYIDDLAEGGPVIRGRDRWRLGRRLAALNAWYDTARSGCSVAPSRSIDARTACG
jgi:hypothetical protein